MNNWTCQCGNSLPSQPALSRYSDQLLCHECGLEEALEEMYESRRELESIFQIVVTSVED